MMQVSRFTPSQQRPSNLTGTRFGESLAAFKAPPTTPNAGFVPLKNPMRQNNEQRFLFNFNGQPVFGGSRLNVVG